MALQDNTLTLKEYISQSSFKTTKIPLWVNQSILFSIQEYHTATITNNSLRYNIYIENIETGKMEQLPFGQERVINDHDQPSPVLYYLFKVEDKVSNDTKRYFYRIIPHHPTSNFHYKTMISAISEYDENLLYEDESRFLRGHRVYRASRKNLLNLINIITNNHIMIINSLNSIYNNPSLRDKRIISKSKYPKKQSSRSIMMNLTSKNSDSIYSTQVIQYSDFSLNRYLVYLLMFCKKQLEKLVDNCSIEVLRNEKFLCNTIKKEGDNPSRRQTYINRQIEKSEERIKKFNSFINKSSDLVLNINRVLSSNYFCNIEPSPVRDSTIIFNSHYSSVETQLYLPLFQGCAYAFDSNYYSILASPIKQTSKLFEAYCLLTLDAAIRELGFEPLNDDFDYNRITRHFINGDEEIE